MLIAYQNIHRLQIIYSKVTKLQLIITFLNKRRSKRDYVKNDSKPKSRAVNISGKSEKSATKRRGRVKRQGSSTKEPEKIGRSHDTELFYPIQHML